jgi:G3E family GTPase
MIPLILVTGFLGAGKTTFLRNLINLFKGKRLALIINEFGKEGIDGSLFKGEDALLSEISDGSIFCSCKLHQFEDVLKRTAKKDPELIIVEASGLSNPQNVYKILNQECFENVDYKGSICIVDALNFHKVLNNALACSQQIRIADLVIMNKTDLVDSQSLQQTMGLITEIRSDITIFETSFGHLEKEWLNNLQLNSKENYPLMQVADITLQKLLLDVSQIETVETLEKFIKLFASDTYRIKGFVKMDSKNYYVDCVSDSIKITPYNGSINSLNKLVVLAGKGLPAKKSINNAIEESGLEINV